MQLLPTSYCAHSAPTRSVARPPLFDREAPVAPPPDQGVRDFEWMGFAGAAAIPVTAIALACFTDLNAMQNAVLSGLAGGLGIVAACCLSVTLEGRERDKSDAAQAAARRYEVELAQHRSSTSGNRPLSPWPRLDRLAGQHAALKSLLTGPECAALTLALANLQEQGVNLDRTPSQLLERAPGKLGAHAQIPGGKRVPIDSVGDLRRLDLAYGHSDPLPYASALNEYLDREYSVSPGLEVQPDSQSSQSRYESFLLLEQDRPRRYGTYDGEVRLNLHEELVAQQYFTGSGRDHGLGNPTLGQAVKDLYAAGLRVDYFLSSSGWKAETPLDAYRVLRAGCHATLTRDGGITLKLEPGAIPDAGRLLGWEQVTSLLHDIPGSPDQGSVVNQLQACERPGFEPAALARSYATVRKSMWRNFGHNAIEVVRALQEHSSDGVQLEKLCRSFAAEPAYEFKETFRPLDDFEAHNKRTIQRVLASEEVRRLAGTGNSAHLEAREGMLVVGGARIRFARA
jgi:hypothetical protein